MNLLFRLFWTLLFSRFRKACGPFDLCLTPYRVWPTDLDILLHVNNGKYFSMMDLARLDLMVRCGLWQRAKKRGWYPVVLLESMRFKKSLKLFQRFMIQTQVITWDDKYTYLLQNFVCQDEIVAQAMIKARFLKKAAAPSLPRNCWNYRGSSPPTSEQLPEWIKQWDESCMPLRDARGNII